MRLIPQAFSRIRRVKDKTKEQINLSVTRFATLDPYVIHMPAQYVSRGSMAELHETDHA
jgi:hypothetical protein